MRELKFRAWRNIDGRLRRYVFSPFAYEYPDPDEPVFHAEYGVNDIRDFMPLADIIEQYTGLKDKNGKEIYEGDIVKVEDDEYTADVDKFYGDNATVERSILKPGAFIVKNWYGERVLRWDISLRRIEVIGNIHENPELLEGEE